VALSNGSQLFPRSRIWSVVKRMLKKLCSSSIFEEAIDKMQLDVVDLPVSSVGHVEDDKADNSEFRHRTRIYP
jgi:hypothetical protein